MTAEKLSEALSFIDDDIIEETEALRSRKDRTDYKIIWLRCLSVAACLCIALVAVFGVVRSDADLGYSDLPLKGGDISYTSPEDNKYGGYRGTLGFGAGAVSYVGEVAYLEITEWKGSCFYATAIEGKNDAFDDGVKVKVKFFSEWVWVEKKTYSDLMVYERKIPSAEEFPAGSRILVVFNDRRNTFLNSKADEVITAFAIECDGTERWR